MVLKMNEFTTVFDYTAGAILIDALNYLAVSVALIIGGILGCIFHKRILEEEPAYTKIILSCCMATLGIVWGAVHMDIFDLALSDIDANTRTAEGVVHVSGMQAFNGHTPGDRITVGGQPFTVDYFYATPGYKQTIARGGALENGVYARLQHINGVILKVEVRTKTSGQQIP
jgi:predicted membrane channel-forming protein YqfA (hemolysin III family)